MPPLGCDRMQQETGQPGTYERRQAKVKVSPSFLSANQVTNYNEKVTTENGKLTDNMRAMSTVHDS